LESETLRQNLARRLDGPRDTIIGFAPSSRNLATAGTKSDSKSEVCRETSFARPNRSAFRCNLVFSLISALILRSQMSMGATPLFKGS